jgi:uridine kinase
LVIGLAGGSGAGKSTVAQAIAQSVGHQHVLILPQDAYYHTHVAVNYDEPSAFDTELLVRHLDALRRGESIARPIYDFTRQERAPETVALEPKPVLVVEGILVLHKPSLRARMDLKVFVDTPADERFIRRLKRDVTERGRTAQSVIDQYRRSVKPMHDRYVEPTKQHADLILPEGGGNKVALDVLSTYVAHLTRHLRASLHESVSH